MHVGDFLLAVASLDEILDHAAAERARAVEGDERDEVGEVLRREVAHELRHAGRLHLEHRPRLTLAEHFRGQLVRQWDLLDVNRLVAALLDVRDRIADDRQRAQAEEVHLE